MNKKFVLALVVAGSLAAGAAGVFAFQVFTGGSRAKPAAATGGAAVAQQTADEFFRAGQAYEKKGMLEEAKTAYQEALKRGPSAALAQESVTRLGDVSMRLLLSPAITPGTAAYEVVPGDSLTAIARRFNTTVEFLIKANALSSDVIRPKMTLKVPARPFTVVVDKSLNTLMLKSGEEVVKIYSVSTGKNNSTPVGTFKVTTKLVDPTWYTTGAVLPPGDPKNILGTRWMGITAAGYGIHGTADPGTIGQQVTAGCVRMRNPEVEELYAILPPGAEVTIVD